MESTRYLTVPVWPEPISRYGVKHIVCRLPTGLPFRCYDVLEASHTRRASPLLAGIPSGITPEPGNSFRLPDKEFRYLRTVIVTAAVYRGLDSRLRPKANLSS